MTPPTEAAPRDPQGRVEPNAHVAEERSRHRARLEKVLRLGSLTDYDTAILDLLGDRLDERKYVCGTDAWRHHTAALAALHARKPAEALVLATLYVGLVQR